jgi:hypothetical protein
MSGTYQFGGFISLLCTLNITLLTQCLCLPPQQRPSTAAPSDPSHFQYENPFPSSAPDPEETREQRGEQYGEQPERKPRTSQSQVFFTAPEREACRQAFNASPSKPHYSAFQPHSHSHSPTRWQHVHNPILTAEHDRNPLSILVPESRPTIPEARNPLSILVSESRPTIPEARNPLSILVSESRPTMPEARNPLSILVPLPPDPGLSSLKGSSPGSSPSTFGKRNTINKMPVI